MEIGPKRKRRLLMVVAALTTLAALATLVAGVTLGLFSSTVSSGDNTITLREWKMATVFLGRQAVAWNIKKSLLPR